MRKLRLACAAFAAWLFLLFNIERIHEPLNLASFVYVMAAVTGCAIIGLKPLSAIRLRWSLGACWLVFVLLKLALGYPVIGQALPITVLEGCAISLTIAISYAISSRLLRLERASAGMISDGERVNSLWAAQSELYREVRRARRHDRPLSVLAMASDGQSLDPDEERLLRELQRELLHNYTNNRIASMLAAEAKDHGIVTHCNRHFVVLLPETDRLAAAQVARRLHANVKQKLGLGLRVGVSTFPDEEVTLVGLLQRAEESMRNGGTREIQTVGEQSVSTEEVLENGSEPAAEPAAEGAADKDTVEIQSGLETVEFPVARETAVTQDQELTNSRTR